MSWFYQQVVRPALFAYDSEKIHDATLQGLATLSLSRLGLDALNSFYEAPRLPVQLWGLEFPNPVGIAAGMDKAAAAVPAWEAMGFGFCELGGVTWHPQPGNPSPRMFRAPADEALVNRMGFNNAGAEAVAKRLREWKNRGLWPKAPVGINVGKSKITPNDQAAEDYRQTLALLQPLADFFVVNVSSPNTPNLRELQDREALDHILGAVQTENHKSTKPKPILVKIAPDLTFSAIDEVLQVAAKHQLAGIVATNTTIERPTTSDDLCKRTYTETGGLSGAPLRKRSTEIIRYIFERTEGRLPIIGVGGIFNADHAWEKIRAGATLVQCYTGLVYEGPSISKNIVCGLIDKLAAEGLSSISQAVGR
ncbi:MAG TPA: quinone-dependent dihydroorotate dehydrogenase [Verrucomicrobiae bacterium]|nr:quinone-dependent dihydroorotate dehydrogenase [Verrucomicrobiae bacterium]